MYFLPEKKTRWTQFTMPQKSSITSLSPMKLKFDQRPPDIKENDIK